MIDFLKSIIGTLIDALGLRKILLRRYPTLTKIYIKESKKTDFQKSNPTLHWWSSVFFAILMAGIVSMCWLFTGMIMSL